MNFLALYDFIQNKMRMSHIYQPVMLITLLEHGGKASVRDIASSICSHDESQLEYYELITKNMVGKVLRNRNIVVKEKDAFGLPGFNNLSNDQILELKNLLIKSWKTSKVKEVIGSGSIGGYQRVISLEAFGMKSLNELSSDVSCVEYLLTIKLLRLIISSPATKAAVMTPVISSRYATPAMR